MLWIQLFFLFFVFLLFCPTIGSLLVTCSEKPALKYFCECFVLGWVVMFALFECIAVPFTFLKFHLSTLTGIWAGIICVIAVMGFLKFHKKYKINDILHFPQYSMSKLKYCVLQEKKLSYVGVLTFILILFQCGIQLFFQHIDEDDAWFVAASVAAVESNSLNQISPYTGDILRWDQATDYLVAPFPLFWAMISKIFSIHPTIIMHTIAPFFLVCAAYMVYYLVGKQIFCNDHHKIELFLFFICLLNLFGFSFPRTTAAMLLLRIWQGKAMVGALLLPLLMYYLYEHTRTKASGKVEFKMTLVMLSMALGSSISIFLGIMLVGIYVIALYLLHKKIKAAVKILWTIIPSTLLGMIYIIIRQVHFS